MVGYLLDGHLAVMAQHGFGLDDDVAVYSLERINARLLFDDSGEMLGR